MMTDKPPISILIPTFNAADLLPEAIESALSLPYDDIEVIVGNDGSTDHTKDVIESYDDPRLLSYHNENNLHFDRNALVITQRANGQYLFYLSDEDQIHPTGFDRLYTMVQSNDDISVYFGDIIDRRPERHGEYYYRNRGHWPDSRRAIVAYATELEGSNGWWSHTYMSGTCVRKDAIDIPTVKTCVGCQYILGAVVSNALLDGGMSWIDDPVVMMGREQANRFSPSGGVQDFGGPDLASFTFDNMQTRIQYARDLGFDDELMKMVLDVEKRDAIDELFRFYGCNIISHLKRLGDTPVSRKEYVVLTLKGALRTLGV